MRPELSSYTHIASGKVRDIYDIDDNTLLMVASDRISAYDFALEPAIPDTVSYTHLTLPTILRV